MHIFFVVPLILTKVICIFAEFDKLNPLHYVPVLVDGDVVISDSYAIFLVGSLKPI